MAAAIGAGLVSCISAPELEESVVQLERSLHVVGRPLQSDMLVDPCVACGSSRALGTPLLVEIVGMRNLPDARRLVQSQ